MKKRLFALLLALLLVCTGCTKKKTGDQDGLPSPEPSAASSTAPSQIEDQPQSPVADKDADRRAALLTVFNTLSDEEAMYAKLCDLNGDGDDDILVFGRRDFDLAGSYHADFCFSGVVWNGKEAELVPFDAFEYLAAFGANTYEIYRDKNTGAFYAGYSFAMDNVAALGFQNAAEYVPMGFECGYETPEELAQWEDLTNELRRQVNQRFDLVETIVFPERQVNGYGIPESFYWTEYWNTFGEERPPLPPFYKTVGNVRTALSDIARGADAETTLPFAPGELSLYFSSGVGGWGTQITIQADGTFQGHYHDSDLGWSGPGYDATVHICSFTGRFKNVKRVGDATWSLTLDTLETADPPGKEWIEDMDGEKVRYLAEEPYGIAGGKEFLLYAPETRCATLDEEFAGWHLGWGDDLSKRDALGCYGLHNLADDSGFFS